MTACRDCGPSRLRPEFPEVWPRDCAACAVKSEVREVRLASKSDWPNSAASNASDNGYSARDRHGTIRFDDAGD